MCWRMGLRIKACDKASRIKIQQARGLQRPGNLRGIVLSVLQSSMWQRVFANMYSLAASLPFRMKKATEQASRKLEKCAHQRYVDLKALCMSLSHVSLVSCEVRRH